MSIPSLELFVQPTDGTSLFYLPIAAKAQGEPAYAKIALRLHLQNTGDSDLTLSGIKFSYPNSPHADSQMQGVKIAVDPAGDDDPDDGVIKAGTTATWSNGVVDLDVSKAGENHHRNEVYLPLPLPQSIVIKVSCHGFASPKTLSMDLVAYTKPASGAALRLPMSQFDLDDGEYLVTSARHWANGGANGTQIYAHDISVQKRVRGDWTQLNDGATKSSNADYRIWGKRLRAVADGIVEEFADHYENNATPGAARPEGTPGSGNFLRIRHGEITVIYAHLLKGSIPEEFKLPNAAVRVGQVIGRAGNSGRSTNPHLHLEGRDSDTNTLRGLPFSRASVLERERINPDQSGPWVRLTADGICQDTVAIRPGWRLGPLAGPQLEAELDELVAEVFGGVSRGGDGFVIIGGKLHRVPPRTPRFKLLAALVSLTEHAQDPHKSAELGRSIEQLGAEIAAGR